MVYRSLIKFVNDMKIRKKLIIIYLIVVVIPILILGMILTDRLRKITISQATREACVNTDRIDSRIREITKLVTDVSDRIYFDRDLERMILTTYDSSWKIVEDYSTYTAFDAYLRYYKEIKSIRFYTENNTMLDNWQFIKANEKIKEAKWYIEALKGDGRILWQYVFDETTSEELLSLTRLIKNDRGQKLGVAVITVDSGYLKAAMKEEPYDTLITLEDHRIVYSNREEQIGKVLNNKQIIEKQKRSEDQNKLRNTVMDAEYEGKASKIIINSFVPIKTGSKIYIISIVPIDTIAKEATKASKLGFAVIGSTLLLSMLLISLFTGLITKRIVKLRKEMHKVVSGNLEVSSEIQGKDEIGELHDDLVTMITSIKQLIHEVYESKVQKEKLKNKQKEIEFKMLSSQINPHFLYNALETIRMKAHSSGQKELAVIVKMLGKIMRRNLEVSNLPVSLESEIELVRNYLYIQKFRFGDKVNYDIEVDCDISEYRILPLLLQPIVENAFVHGMENKLGEGKILIRLEKNQKYLIVSVIDDGIGVEEEKLKSIKRALCDMEHKASGSIGLSNVNQRIKLYYGEPYGIGIFSKAGEGTKIDILLPIGGDTIAEGADN